MRQALRDGAVRLERLGGRGFCCGGRAWTSKLFRIRASRSWYAPCVPGLAFEEQDVAAAGLDRVEAEPGDVRFALARDDPQLVVGVLSGGHHPSPFGKVSSPGAGPSDIGGVNRR